MRSRALLTAATALATLALTSCSAFSESTEPGSDGEVRVAAAFYPLAYVAERVAGEHAEVDNLTTLGTEPHDLSLDVAQTVLISEADLVLYESGFQTAVDAGVEQNAEGERLDVDDVVDLLPAPEHEQDHGDEEHSEDDGHDHGEFDPHFWQDPLRLATYADAVAERLAAIDPDHADDYAANAAGLRSDLETLDAAYADGLADCERDTIVVSHDAFGYLARYGLQVEGIAGLSPDAEPTPADLGRLQSLIRTDGITTVFSETLAPKQIAETLADDMGVSSEVLDPIEGLTDETSDQDYLSLMQTNLSRLEEANGCQTS